MHAVDSRLTCSPRRAPRSRTLAPDAVRALWVAGQIRHAHCSASWFPGAARSARTPASSSPAKREQTRAGRRRHIPRHASPVLEPHTLTRRWAADSTDVFLLSDYFLEFEWPRTAEDDHWWCLWNVICSDHSLNRERALQVAAPMSCRTRCARHAYLARHVTQ